MTNNRNIHRGGSRGRPNNLHKGYRTLSSGGTNAQGSQKKVGNGQWFQYGHDQWGFNRGGKTDWNTKGPKLGKGGKPKGGATIGNWHQIKNRMGADRLAGMPTFKKKKRKKPHLDSFYNEDLENYAQQRDDRLRGIERDRADKREQYGLSMGDIGDAYAESFDVDEASQARRGLTGSGIQRATNAKRSKDRDRAQADVELSTGEMWWGDGGRLANDAQRASDHYSSQKASLERQAVARWKEDHDGSPPPTGLKKGFKKQGSTWFFTGKDGRKVSLGSKKPLGVAIQEYRKQLKGLPKGSDKRKRLQKKIKNAQKQQKNQKGNK